MADFNWYGGSGDVGDPNNWLNQPDPQNPVNPGPDDNALISGSDISLVGSLTNVAGFYFSGGAIYLNLGSLQANFEFDDEASIVLNSGTLSVNVAGNPGNEDIGTTGTGAFTQNGGVNTVASGLLLGYGTGGDGTYNLFGGTLNAAFEIIGGSGVGNFTQSGGTNTAGTASSGLTLGSQQGSFGNYYLQNDSKLSANVETIGDQGTGTFIQSGTSTNNVSQGLTVGNGPVNPLALGPSTYYLTGGTLTVGTGNEAIGGTGTGQFNQNAGTDNEVSSGLLLGYGTGGDGTYNLFGGTLNAAFEIIGGSGVGNFTQSGGTNTASGDLIVGDNGQGTFAETGGTAGASNLFIANQAGSQGDVTVSGAGTVLKMSDTLPGIADQIGFTGRGTLNVTAGGEVDDGGTLVLAFHPGATGTLAVASGGTVNTRELVIGGGATPGGIGTVTASTGGVVNVTGVDPTNGFSVFMWPSATIDTTGGGSVDIGATVTSSAGSVSIGTTGVLTGAGHIAGNLIDGGRVEAFGGTLSVTGATNVTGLLLIGHGATLDLNGSETGRVTFADGTSVNGIGTTLELHPQSDAFNGSIRGLKLGDAIDLANTVVTNPANVTTAGGILTVVTDAGQTLTYNVGNIGTQVFAPQSDGKGGTDLILSNGIVTLDQDVSEQAALKLTIGNTDIGLKASPAVPFTIAGLDSEDTGSVTFTDANGKTVVVNVTGGQTTYTANLSTLADGAMVSSLAVNTDPAGNTFQPVAGNTVTLDQDVSEQTTLKLTIGNTDIGLKASPAVPFTIAGLDSEDTGSVTFTDANGKTVVVNVTGGQTTYTANLSTLADGPIVSSLAVNIDPAGNTFQPVAGNPFQYRTIDDPGEAQTQLYAINNKGEIVGAGLDAPSGVFGFAHSFIAGSGNFDFLSSPELSTAFGVNDTGTIVGGYFNGSVGYGYVGVPGNLATIVGLGTNTNATAIDSAGDIVGTTGNPPQAFIDIGGKISIITLPSTVRWITTSPNGTLAITYGSASEVGTLSTGFHNLNLPAGAIIQGINDKGQIVGYQVGANGLGDGFLMDTNGIVYSIDIPGAAGTRAEGINNNGNIVGYYYDAAHNEHGFETSVSSVEAATVLLDRDVGEQAALRLTVGLNDINATAAAAVPFTIAGLDSEDTGTVTFTDAQHHIVLVGVNGGQTSYTADLSSLAIGPIASSLAVNTDSAGNGFAPVAGNSVVASGNDVLYVGNHGGTVHAGNSNSVIDGTAGNETISAGNGADVIVGGPNDVITAGNGNDTVYGSSSDTITLGNGTDTVIASDSSTIRLGNGNDTVIAGANSAITIGNGNDHLTVGNNSAITLGNGNDTIVYKLDSSSPATTIYETITGLSASDSLDFADINFATVKKPVFAGTTAGGTLTITDGTHTADVTLNGNFLNSSWNLSSDGNGGTLIIDPPSKGASSLVSSMDHFQWNWDAINERLEPRANEPEISAAVAFGPISHLADHLQDPIADHSGWDHADAFVVHAHDSGWHLVT